ncbi:MAG: hypothetical protein MJZ02_08165, partial [Paludibacteraceae bacterium]|nr:hypothetical protein [Paludibacteraceae bacterium]
MVEVGQEDATLIKQGQFNKLNDELKRELEDGEFVVEDALKEKDDYLKSFKAQQDAKLLSIKLLLSTTCNSKCVY